MSLIFNQFFKWTFINLYCSRFIFISNTCEKCFPTCKKSDLTYNSFCIKLIRFIVRITCSPNMFVTSHNKSIILLSGYVAQSSKRNIFYSEILICITVLLFFLKSKIIEKCISILTTTCKSHVVIEPINASNFAAVSFTLHILRTFLSVKIVNINLSSSKSSRKHMTSVTESNLSTTFKLNTWWRFFKTSRKYIHKLYFILECNYNMKTWRMKCNCCSFITSLTFVLNFKFFCYVIPNINITSWSCDYNCFSQTNIHSSNTCWVKLCVKRLHSWNFSTLRIFSIIREFYC